MSFEQHDQVYEATLDDQYTFGIIMIKPNAVDQVLDPVITATFEGDVQPVFEQEGCNFVKQLDSVDLCGRYYRDLQSVPYGTDLIDLFYGDKSDRRYYPMIQEYYLGKAAFMLLGYKGGQEDFDGFLLDVKGEAPTYDGSGEIVTAARGVRGALTEPYRHYSREASLHLDDADYRTAFSPVVQNFIHVCDTPEEVSKAMTYLLDDHEVQRLNRDGYPVDSFLDTYLK